MKLKYFLKRLYISLKEDSFFNIIKKIFYTILGTNKINLDKLDLPENKSLDDLFLIFGTDKGKYDGKKTYHHLQRISQNKEFKNYLDFINRKKIYDYDYQLGNNFSPIYEKLFSGIRGKKINFLELGVANGHSLASWYMFFKNANIYGIDIKKKSKLFYKGNRLTYFSVDITSTKAIKNFLKKNLEFNIIVDDSLHDYQGFFSNFKNFYPIVSGGGIYILEDFHSSDIEKLKVREFNVSRGHKILEPVTMTMEEFFNNIKNKKNFQNSYLSEEEIKYIIQNTKDVAVEYTEHPHASLAIIHKN